MEGEEKIKKFFFLFLGSGLLHAQSVWVIEKPAALRILNAFEQTVSSQDLEKWPVFSPVEMLEWSSLLGDGFTTAAKVRFDSRVFYIQRTTSGSLIGADRVGAMYPIPDGRRLQDTMIVDRPEGLHLHLWPSGLRTTIPQAEHLERFWQWENRQFVKRTSTGDMGWVIVDDHSSWSRYQPVRQTTPFNPVETVQS
ncbi:MAG: hypothetical protein KDC45_14480, partial [Bacteroidetes bacterium]|nr:hypothetical protein [Bacteroidota bacterium]